MGRNGLRLILIHLLNIRIAQTSIAIPTVITFTINLDFPILYGTSMQHMYTEFSLKTAEIRVANDECGNAYGKCRSYCQDPKFCRLYCSPICCLAKAWTGTECEDQVEGYHRNSTALKISKDYWRDMDLQRYGVWAEDAIGFRQYDGTFIDVGVQRLALQTVQMFDKTGILPANIGLGRDPDNKNFVQMLYDKGHIEEEKVTMVLAPSFGMMVFGKFSEFQYRKSCSPKWDEVKACGTREWMFEAIKVSFFDYTSEHNYKIILINSGLKMPRHLLVQFINDGFLVPFETNVEWNVYSVNTTGRSALKYEFMLNSNFTLHINESSLNSGPYTTLETLSATAIDPNPDNVEWMFGSMVFREYCIQLDYKNNMLGFSKALQDESDNLRPINQNT
ncbi:unnamed protein product [Bursaphelenchus xylophilus]|uniref:(pine wood nematode) hypothetical protein n=1 Tax=Bursaphelenchus xylophilus TaxID=6326 RepID=A0A7I8WLW1_BURXY|nr:unnamed protein product [Bursaphelenchus xylophilus]CAG9104987.1 unnamed protein product [Bursaphelenchus xylophilus]